MITADTTSEKEILPLADVLKNIKGVSFLSLQLMDKNKKSQSNNVYWMSPAHDFTSLKGMPSASLEMKVIKMESISNQYQWTIEFSNDSKQLAFFINPQLMIGDEEVLPSFWSDNYFSIPAGERKTVTLSCKKNKFNKETPQLKLEGWNIKEQSLSLPLSVNMGKK